MISIHITDLILAPLFLILFGFSIAYIKRKEFPKTLDMIYKIVVLLAIIVFTLISSAYYVAWITNNGKILVELLIPLGVLISAALASISVLKSIENTNRIEKEKKLSERNKQVTYFAVSMANTYKIICDIEDKHELSKKHRYHRYFSEVVKLSDKLKNLQAIMQDKDILFYIKHSIIQSYYTFNTKHTTILCAKIADADIAQYDSIPMNGYVITKAINTLKKEFTAIEKMLYQEYGEDVKELEIILNQVYEKARF